MNQRREFPLIFQESWILDQVKESLKRNKVFVNSYVKKNCTGKANVLPILRVSKFLKTRDDLSITAILSDSTHKILAIFPYNSTIIDFETKYGQRITYKTVNSSFMITKFDIKFIDPAALAKDYGFSSKDTDIVVLEILEAEVFQRDQVEISNNIEKTIAFIYQDSDYISLSTPRKGLYDKLKVLDDTLEDSIAET